jgi:hypothetical protein
MTDFERLIAIMAEMRYEIKAARETNNEKFEVLQENMWTIRHLLEAKMDSHREESRR